MSQVGTPGSDHNRSFSRWDAPDDEFLAMRAEEQAELRQDPTFVAMEARGPQVGDRFDAGDQVLGIHNGKILTEEGMFSIASLELMRTGSDPSNYQYVWKRPGLFRNPDPRYAARNLPQATLEEFKPEGARLADFVASLG